MLNDSKFVEAYQRKARANLAEATFCLDALQPRAAISRAYYALYQAANAWLMYASGGNAFDPERPNLSHDEIEDRWPGILDEIHVRLGIESDYDGDRIFGMLKGLRVRSERRQVIWPSRICRRRFMRSR